MAESIDGINLLVLKSGRWLVGVEPQSVAGITRAAPGAGKVSDKVPEKVKDLCTLFGEQSSAETSRFVRYLQPVGVDKAWRIDAVHSTRYFSLGEIHPLPPTLKYLGGPAWCLGFAWLDGQSILLIDLAKAANAQGEAGGP